MLEKKKFIIGVYIRINEQTNFIVVINERNEQLYERSKARKM